MWEWYKRILVVEQLFNELLNGGVTCRLEMELVRLAKAQVWEVVWAGALAGTGAGVEW